MAQLEIEKNMIVLCGPNGAGKTNLLEAVSLLTPGRGLRSAKAQDIKNKDSSDAEYWAVSADVQTPNGLIKIGTGQMPAEKKRIIKIDGIKIKSQAELAEYTSAIWLTPQMDRLFIGSPIERRKFFDQLALNFDHKHVSRINKYDKAMRERAKILRNEFGTPDPAWLALLEKTMAETSVAIAANRQLLIDKLQKIVVVQQHDYPLFPVPRIELKGWVEESLGSMSALEVEELFKKKLEENRPIDAMMGGAKEGVHRSDFIVWHHEHGLPADQCSTGEQKGLLLSITLGHACLVHGEFGYTPLLLLDEVVAHLDEDRRKSLFNLLHSIQGQCWMTGTDIALFDGISNEAEVFDIQNAMIEKIK